MAFQLQPGHGCLWWVRTNSNGSALENITEAYGYDKLNRLTTSTTSGVFGRTQTYQYDTGGLGNLINRSDVLTGTSFNNDVGELKYDQLRNAGVHAVTSATGVNYSYDKYGNMTARGSESILYDTFNKPTRIVGASITDFYYGPDHELYKETSGTKTTYKLAGGMYEVIVDGTTTTQKSYVDGVILNNRILTNGTQSANDTVYLHTDHLGSVEATTNALGQFVNRMSFGAWGERQKSDWKPGSPTENFLTTNGYTGHDQLDSHNLIHMGGRVYDPNLGRFLSADIVVQSPYDSQSYNRYSYTSNNPLSYTDPTGYMSDLVNYMINQTYSHSGSWMWGNDFAQSKAQIDNLQRLKEEQQKLEDYQRAGLIKSYKDGIKPDYSEMWSTGELSSEIRAVCYSGPTGCMGRLLARQGMDATGLSPSDMMSLLRGLEHLSNIAGIAGVAKAVGGKVVVRELAENKASAYSVAVEVTIAPQGNGTRRSHFKDANTQLQKAMERDPDFAKLMSLLGVKIPANIRTSPDNWTWHHVPNQPGVLQLVPRPQHQPGSVQQSLLHPNGKGGFSIWGDKY